MPKSIGVRVARENTDIYRGNILAIYESSTDLERLEGMQWYADARAFCGALAAEYGYSIEAVAGVVSAVSPRSPWGRNKEIARELVRRFSSDIGFRGLTINTNAAIAYMILAGDDPREHFRDKRLAFWHNILGHYDQVTLDAHMVRILTRDDEYETIASSAYCLVESVVQDAADEVGIPPAHLQAITWVTWRNAKYTSKHLSYLDRTREMMEVA